MPLTFALSHPFPRYFVLIFELASNPPQARTTDLHRISFDFPLCETFNPTILLFFLIIFLAANSYFISIPFFITIFVSDLTNPSPWSLTSKVNPPQYLVTPFTTKDCFPLMGTNLRPFLLNQ